jgi:hypothetical protein
VWGTSERLGPPASSAASVMASNFSVAARQLSNSSTVSSRASRRAMMLAPLRVENEPTN